jgi:plastocyanin
MNAYPKRWSRRLIAAAAVTATVGALAAFGPWARSGEAQPTERRIFMAAIEPRGSASVEQEAFPAAELPKGGGYILRSPEGDGRWEVSTYRYTPGSFVVHEGDSVTLEIVGINGREHPSVVEGLNVSFNVKRGQLTEVSFRAERAGIYQIVCQVHRPSMTAQMVVLPRP